MNQQNGLRSQPPARRLHAQSGWSAPRAGMLRGLARGLGLLGLECLLIRPECLLILGAVESRAGRLRIHPTARQRVLLG